MLQKLKRVLRDNRAQLGTGTAIAVIILIAAIMIGALIMTKMGGKVKEEINKTGDTQALQNVQDVEDTGWSALTMLALSGFVGAAVVILALLMGLISGRRGGGGY
jgi:hypothetical protein